MRNHARAEGVLQRFGAGEAALNEDGCGCGCAAQNEDENEVEVKIEGEVEDWPLLT